MNSKLLNFAKNTYSENRLLHSHSEAMIRTIGVLYTLRSSKFLNDIDATFEDIKKVVNFIKENN